MYDISEEGIAFLFFAFLALAIGLLVGYFLEWRYGLLASLLAFLFSAGLWFFVISENKIERLIGSASMAFATSIITGLFFGAFAGILAFALVMTLATGILFFGK